MNIQNKGKNNQVNHLLSKGIKINNYLEGISEEGKQDVHE